MNTASPTDTSTHQDQDLAFYIQVHKDEIALRDCLPRLRKAYPASSIILVSDNDTRPVWDRLAKRFGCRYFPGEYLYGIESGGRILLRQLDHLLNTPKHPAKWLSKIDPDTRVHRRLHKLPTEYGAHGTLEHDIFGEPVSPPSLQGGAQIFTREAAQYIVDSGLLTDDKLLDYKNTYAQIPAVAYRATSRGQLSQDYLLRYVCMELDVPIFDFDEIYTLGTGPVDLAGRDVAISHPYKPFRLKLRKLTNPGGSAIILNKLKRLVGKKR